MSTDTQVDTRETIDSYLSDMLALDRHIVTALAGQIEGQDEHSAVKGPLVLMHAVFERHVRELETLAETREQNVRGVSKVVKSAVSSVLGLGAAVIDMVRTEKLPKNLRDDYTAFSLAYIGNLMLHTTALSLRDTQVASLARVHMSDHAESLMKLQRVIPSATVGFLSSEGLEVDATVLGDIDAAIEQAWR